MRVGVNVTTFTPQPVTGEQIWLRKVLDEIWEIRSNIELVLFTDEENHDSFERWQRLCIGKAEIGKEGLSDATARRLSQLVHKVGVNLLLSPLSTAPPQSPTPLVLVALDLSAWENPTQIHHRRATASLKEVKQICSEAAAIVAPSEWIRRKFLEIFSVPMDKVVVAPPGIEETFGHPQECIVQKPFFIATATMHPSGNFSCLREAFVRLKRELPHILAVVGPADDAEPADWDPCMLRIERLPRSLLAGLYQHCDAYICPTLHEGSGMTMLEAMRAGARIISSRVGAIPEVAGDLPIYFNPESPASLVTAVHRALGEDPAERSKLLRSGKQVAAEYTWEKCACKTLLALRHACDPHE